MSHAIFRGKTFTREDVEKAIKRFDQEPRNTFSPLKKYSVKHHGKDYPPKDLLRLVVGEVGRFSGGEPTNRLFRDLGFQIEERGLPDDEGVIEDALDTSLSLEADLEDALVPNLAQLEKGLRLYAENSASGRQFDAKAAGRIDLLAVDSRQNLVVIELKAGTLIAKCVARSKLTWTGSKQTWLVREKLRGIIVAHDFTERAKLAATVVPGLTLKKYEVNFVFANV
jgi:hypothetical protein